MKTSSTTSEDKAFYSANIKQSSLHKMLIIIHQFNVKKRQVPYIYNKLCLGKISYIYLVSYKIFYKFSDNNKFEYVNIFNLKICRNGIVSGKAYLGSINVIQMLPASGL